MNIHHLIYVNSHGDIRMIKPSKGDNNPAEGVDSATGMTLIHYNEAIQDLNSFMNTKYWNSSTSTWTTRTERPNRYAEWENEAWTWDSDTLLADIREERRIRLAKSDWALVPDSPLTDSEQTEVRTYRTALRDLPSTLDMTTISSLDAVTWPTKPACLG